ncbi:MAG: hypothetical protein EZS28_049737, partial [Streblomastix strix]
DLEKEKDRLNEKERELARQRKKTQDPDIKSIVLQPEDKEKGSIFELTNQLRCGQDKNKDQLPAAKELYNKIADNIDVRDQIERSELLNVLADHTRAEQAPDPLFVYSSGILNLIALSDAVEGGKPKTAQVIAQPLLHIIKSNYKKQSKQASQALNKLIEDSEPTKDCMVSNDDIVKAIEQIL